MICFEYWDYSAQSHIKSPWHDLEHVSEKSLLREFVRMSSRPRRVPPPPPPGFGDEEYYKLYGEPEEYQKYRYVSVWLVLDLIESVQEG